MAAKEFIVAIELGSSKMTGIAGQKNLLNASPVLSGSWRLNSKPKSVRYM